MKHLLLITLASCLAMVSCNPKDIDDGPQATFNNITVTPDPPKAGQAIVITANMSAQNEPFVAVLEWKEDIATASNTATFTKVKGDLYSATIPPQVVGTKLVFNLRASTQRGKISRTVDMFINIQTTPI